MKYLKLLYNNFEEALSAGVMLFMTVLAFVNVVLRLLAPSISFSFTEELNTKLFVLISLLGAAIAAKRKSHLGMCLLTDMLKKKARDNIIGAGYILSGLFCGLMAWLGAQMTVSEFRLNQLSSGMQWPEWIFGIYLPIGAVCVALRFFVEGIKLVGRKADREEGGQDVI